MIKLFALLALSFFGHEALSDAISNPRHQMQRQQELVDQTKNPRQTIEQERSGNIRVEINIENAIQDFNNNQP